MPADRDHTLCPRFGLEPLQRAILVALRDGECHLRGLVARIPPQHYPTWGRLYHRAIELEAVGLVVRRRDVAPPGAHPPGQAWVCDYYKLTDAGRAVVT